jgi:hypothetical protein
MFLLRKKIKNLRTKYKNLNLILPKENRLRLLLAKTSSVLSRILTVNHLYFCAHSRSSVKKMGSHIPSIEQEAPHKQPRQTMPVNFFGPSVYSKFYKALICAVVLASPMLASAQQTSINNTACVQNYNAATDANTDYFPNKVDADDATYFQISYHNNYKLLVNSYTNETFALYQCGTPQPTGLANGTKFFPVPVSNVAVMETIVVPYLEVSRVEGICAVWTIQPAD